MSRTAPYQWICLRAIKPRTQLRTLATEASTAKDDNTTATEQPPPTSNADLKSYLQNQDTAFLRTTKSHLSQIGQTARAIQDLATSIPRDASQIHLLPSIPPYTTTLFRRQNSNPLPTIKSLLTHISVLDANLTDLEYTPYPSEDSTTPSKADKFKKKLSEWSEQEKLDALEDLRAVEVSHAGRLMRSTEALKGYVEALEGSGKRKGKVENPFRRVETVGMVGEEEGRRGGGFGAGGMDVKGESGEEGRVSNPFLKGSGKEKKAMGDTAKAKERKGTIETATVKANKTAVDTAKAKGEAPTKVADAVDVPKPEKRKSLAELQAELDKANSTK